MPIPIALIVAAMLILVVVGLGLGAQSLLGDRDRATHPDDGRPSG